MIDREALVINSCGILPITIDGIGEVGMRRIGAADLIRIRDLEFKDDQTEAERLHAMAVFLACVLCNERGELLFVGDDIALIERLPYESLEKLAHASQKHNGIDAASREDRQKNSESGQT